MTGVLLYVIDSLRFDHVGPDSEGASLTPHIDSLASVSAVFSNAMSQATWSLPSAASILTGVYPAALGMMPKMVGLPRKHGRIKLPKNVATIAGYFSRMGYNTVALTANPFVAKRFGMHRGFNQIPDMYEHPAVNARERLYEGLKKRLGRKRVPAIVTGNDLHQALKSGDLLKKQDFFALLWSMDAHPPLFDRYRIDEMQPDDSELINTVVSAKHQLTNVRSLYRKMVRYADAQIGSLIQELKSRDQYDNAIIIITADHGESFGEHGMFGHAGFPYETQIHVPLVIKFPNGQHAGRKCSELVGLVDLLPTLADWFNFELDTPTNGSSILPILNESAEGHSHLVILDQTRDGRWDYAGVRDAKSNYIARIHKKGDRLPLVHRLRMLRYFFTSSLARQRLQIMRRIKLGPFRPIQEELYDMQTDAGESHNLIYAQDKQSRASRAREQVLEFIANSKDYFREHVGEVSIAEVDDRVQNRLADLGYFE